MTKLERIDALIQKCEDKKLLKLLNRKWWKVYFEERLEAFRMQEQTQVR